MTHTTRFLFEFGQKIKVLASKVEISRTFLTRYKAMTLRYAEFVKLKDPCVQKGNRAGAFGCIWREFGQKVRFWAVKVQNLRTFFTRYKVATLARGGEMIPCARKGNQLCEFERIWSKSEVEVNLSTSCPR